MTIHIVSLAALSPAAADAMRRGVEVECGEPTCQYGSVPMGSDKDGMEHRAKCPRCLGRGRVRYWDVSKGPLARAVSAGRGGIENRVSKWDSALRLALDFADTQPSNIGAQNIKWLIDAIRPGDVLVHDGTELGQRCAEVVARVAAERGAK